MTGACAYAYALCVPLWCPATPVCTYHKHTRVDYRGGGYRVTVYTSRCHSARWYETVKAPGWPFFT